MFEQSTSQLADIYSYYISIRQGGAAVPEAIDAIGYLVDQISEDERTQLMDLLSGWEIRVGQELPEFPPMDNHLVDDETAQLPENWLQSDSDQGPQFARKECSHCGKPYQDNDFYCSRCGQVVQFISETNKVSLNAITNTNILPNSTSAGTELTIALQVGNLSTPLWVQINDEIIIGRSAPGGPIRPDVDLGAFEAETLGVSRLHMSLKREEKAILLTDLDSRNGTYLNGERVFVDQFRVLRHGDELRLGKLVIKVWFNYKVSAI
jgi:hypothetical protein